MRDLEKIYDFLHIAGRLKDTYRFSEVSNMKDTESSADHSWRLSLLVFMMAEELKLDINILRAVKIAITHDLAESLTGDIDIKLLHNNSVTHDEKHDNEQEAMDKLTSMLPESHSEEIMDLWKEYEDAKTPEARFVKALDKIEGLTYLNECGGEAYDDPTLIGTYGNKTARDFPEVIPFFKILKKRLKDQCLKAGFEWKKEYDL